MAQGFRHVAIYYRDENKVMRRIPDTVLFISQGKLVSITQGYLGQRIKLD